MKKSRGFALVAAISISVILLILALAIFIQSNVAVGLENYQEAMEVAEAGVETIRGWAQIQAASSLALGNTDSSKAPFSGVAMTNSAGTNVTYASPAAGGAQAFGIPMKDPVSGRTLGYYAFLLQVGTPIEVFAIGGTGSSPTSMDNVRELHVTIKIYSYGQYAFFEGDAKNPTTFGPGALDAITNQPLSQVNLNCPGPSCTDSSYTGFIPGGNSYLSFHKEYYGGKVVLDYTGSSVNELTGLSHGEYIFNNPNATAFTVNQTTYTPPGGNSGLWTSNGTVSLPNTTGLTNLMQGLYDQGKSNGLFIYDSSDPHFEQGGNPLHSWVPINPTGGWDPETDTNKVSIVLDSSGSQSCTTDGTHFTHGDIQLINKSTTKNMSYLINGSTTPVSIPHQTVGSTYTASICINTVATSYNGTATPLNTNVVYVDGNMGISSTANGYTGNYSWVSPGKITIEDNLASVSFLSQNTFPPPAGTYFQSSNTDLSALIAPYKILISPPNTTQADGVTPEAEGLKISMALIQLGTVNNGVNNMPYGWATQPADANNFTITLDESSSVYNNNGTLQTYSNLYLYGTQIQNVRSDPYQNYTHVYQAFDANLLAEDPPFAPNLSAGYNVTGWSEVNRTSGADMLYDTP